MENNENPFELNSVPTIVFIQTMNFPTNSLSQLSSVLSNPLFSSIVALYTLILLYLPQLFLKFLFSPVLLLTGIILLTLIRFGSTQESKQVSKRACKEKEFIEDHQRAALACKSTKESESVTEDFVYDKEFACFACKSDTESESEQGFELSLNFEENFVEWDVKAPLEVIYEECEGEDDLDSVPVRDHRYPSLSLYHPESDSDDGSSSDEDFPAVGKWELPESLYFRWEEEDREGLIEIALDHKRHSEFQFEEDNLIEIDISPKCHEEW